jgi:competence ComEA-like helix-hairpin-helix protein
MNTTGFVPTSLVRRIAAIVALCALVATGTATWLVSSTADAKPAAVRAAAPTPAKAAPQPDADADDGDDERPAKKGSKKQVSGKLNLNSATDEQLQMLPGVGPSKAERVVAWRQKNGGFKRVADLRKVKGFGFKTLKKLEPYLDIKGETTLRVE